MAEHKSAGGNRKYYYVFQGKLRRKADQGESDEVITRENKLGKTVHEMEFEAISGYLQDMKSEKNDYGVQLQYVFKDGEEEFILNLPFDNDFTRDLNMRLLNMSPKTIGEKELKLSVFQYDRDGSEYKTGFCVPQVQSESGEWQNVARKFTKESPGNLPPWEQVEDPKNGEMVWSKLKQNHFLAKETKALIDESKKFQKEVSKPVSAPSQSMEVPEDPFSTPEPKKTNNYTTKDIDSLIGNGDDDLPF